MFNKPEIKVPTPLPTQLPPKPEPSLDELLEQKVKLDELIRRKAELSMEAQLTKFHALAAAMGTNVKTLVGLNEVAPTIAVTERKKREVKPKYRSPSGELWSGRGRPPVWLQEMLQLGRQKEEFLIEPQPTPTITAG